MTKKTLAASLFRSVAFLSAMLAFATARANVNCTGIPSATKVGEFGNQAEYLIVTISGRDYRLGPATDDRAKARLSLASAALVAGKTLALRFWAESDCDGASANRTVPESLQLVR